MKGGRIWLNLRFVWPSRIEKAGALTSWPRPAIHRSLRLKVYIRSIVVQAGHTHEETNCFHQKPLVLLQKRELCGACCHKHQHTFYSLDSANEVLSLTQQTAPSLFTHNWLLEPVTNPLCTLFVSKEKFCDSRLHELSFPLILTSRGGFFVVSAIKFFAAFSISIYILLLLISFGPFTA